MYKFPVIYSTKVDIEGCKYELKMQQSIKIFTKLTSGDITISEHSQYNYVNANKVVVHEKITARIYGTVKDVTIKKDATVHLHGKILGNVVNEGGELKFYKVE